MCRLKQSYVSGSRITGKGKREKEAFPLSLPLFGGCEISPYTLCTAKVPAQQYWRTQGGRVSLRIRQRFIREIANPGSARMRGSADNGMHVSCIRRETFAAQISLRAHLYTAISSYFPSFLPLLRGCVFLFHAVAISIAR